jgi:ADP-ribosylglycohydrolase
MAFNDARISHVKNGIYGEMFVSAMIACAAVTDNIEEIIKGGLAQIPAKSRLYEAVTKIMDDYKKGVSLEECYDYIHSAYDEYTDHGWCHVISNAMIVVAALLYGEGDFGKSICMAVQTAFDTDCNGATVGSILGMRGGIDCISEYWRKPVNGKIHTSIFGVGTVNIDEAVEKTMEHI